MRRGPCQNIPQLPVALPGLRKASKRARTLESEVSRALEIAPSSFSKAASWGAPGRDSVFLQRPSGQDGPRAVIGIGSDSDGRHMNRDAAAPHDTPNMLVCPAPISELGGGSVGRIDIDKRGGPSSGNGEF